MLRAAAHRRTWAVAAPTGVPIERASPSRWAAMRGLQRNAVSSGAAGSACNLRPISSVAPSMPLSNVPPPPSASLNASAAEASDKKSLAARDVSSIWISKLRGQVPVFVRVWVDNWIAHLRPRRLHCCSGTRAELSHLSKLVRGSQRQHLQYHQAAAFTSHEESNQQHYLQHGLQQHQTQRQPQHPEQQYLHLEPLQKAQAHRFQHRANGVEGNGPHDIYLCTSRCDNTGPACHWKDPHQAHKLMLQLYDHAVGSIDTLYIMPFCMAPLTSPVARYGILVTDSPTAVLEFASTTNVGQECWQNLSGKWPLAMCVHISGESLANRAASAASPVLSLSRQQHQLQMQANSLLPAISTLFPETFETLSAGCSDVVVPDILGKQGLGLRLASRVSTRENPRFSAENMAVYRVRSPYDTVYFIGCVHHPQWPLLPPPAMLAGGWDISLQWSGPTWMYLDAHGLVRAASPFRVNNLGLGESQLLQPDLPPQHTDALGVPLAAILLENDRSDVLPLVYETPTWEEGVLAAVSLRPHGVGGDDVGQYNPMGMRAFLGYPMRQYIEHWLAMPLRTLRHKLPRVFVANWGRVDPANGCPLWPGGDDNVRILRWITERLDNVTECDTTPIGFVPYSAVIDMPGGGNSGGWSGTGSPLDADLPKLLRVRPHELFGEMQRLKFALAEICEGAVPPRLEGERVALMNRAKTWAARFGQA